jgi:hypothetical protein
VPWPIAVQENTLVTVTLTTIGSRSVTIHVAPAALPEAGPGGVAIELGLRHRALILTLTREEALLFRSELDRLLPSKGGGPALPPTQHMT